MQILIIGGTGFIGRHVVHRLAEEGHAIVVLHRRAEAGGLPDGVRHVAADRRVLRDAKPQLDGLVPDIVLDMIPYTEDDAATVMEVFRGRARRVVAISSVDVYRAYDLMRGVETGPAAAVLLDEAAPLRRNRYPYRLPATPPDALEYRYEKILVEHAVLGDSSLPGTVLRLPAVYGPGDAQRRVGGYLRAMDDGRPAILLDERKAAWRWTRGYVENVADAIALAVADDRATGQVYNVGEETAQSEADWVRSIAAVAGWPGRVVTVAPARLPAHLVEHRAWQHDLAADTSRIRRDLDYRERVSLSDGLRRTVAWERAQTQPAHSASVDYAAEDALLTALGYGGD